MSEPTPEPVGDRGLKHLLDDAQSVSKHRILGPADYRGWVLHIDTIDVPTLAAIADGEPGPHYAKRWQLGQSLAYCLVMLVRFHLTGRAPDAIGQEEVLNMRLARIDLKGAP